MPSCSCVLPVLAADEKHGSAFTPGVKEIDQRGWDAETQVVYVVARRVRHRRLGSGMIVALAW